MCRVLVTGLLLAGFGAVEAQARSFYCERQLVSVGDPIWSVARKCPDPFWSERFDRVRARDRRGDVLAAETVEWWYLNFGQRRLMRRLEFVDGRLNRIDRLGYGVDFEPGSRRCTVRQLENAGRTMGEIYARCGEPDYQYAFPLPGDSGRWLGPGRPPVDRRIWVYDFGGRFHVRELLFIDGHLEHISARERG